MRAVKLDLVQVYSALVASMIQDTRAFRGRALTDRELADILRVAPLQVEALARVERFGWHNVMFATREMQGSDTCACTNHTDVHHIQRGCPPR